MVLLSQSFAAEHKFHEPMQNGLLSIFFFRRNIVLAWKNIFGAVMSWKALKTNGSKLRKLAKTHRGTTEMLRRKNRLGTKRKMAAVKCISRAFPLP